MDGDVSLDRALTRSLIAVLGVLIEECGGEPSLTEIGTLLTRSHRLSLSSERTPERVFKPLHLFYFVGQGPEQKRCAKISLITGETEHLATCHRLFLLAALHTAARTGDRVLTCTVRHAHHLTTLEQKVVGTWTMHPDGKIDWRLEADQVPPHETPPNSSPP